MKIEELRSRLIIDKGHLDDEISKQPMLFFDVAEQCEIALAERDALKEDLATVDAELDKAIRLKLGDEGTEAKVKHQIQADKRHRAAFEAYIEAKANAGKLIALKDSFEQRNYMLRSLASLYVSSYFENTSTQGTNATDTVRYRERRRIMGEARRERQHVD